MQDVISKITLGFLMAQLLPGAIIVYCVTFAWLMFNVQVESLGDIGTRTLDLWVATRASYNIIFVALSAAAGMALHGINWTVLGFLENRHKIINPNDSLPKAATESFWHNLPIGLQIMLGPIKATLEIS